MTVEVWDDDDALGGDDFIDSFIIANLSSEFHFNESNSLTSHGVKGLGNLSLVFYNLTTNPTLRNAKDHPTPNTISVLPGGTYVAFVTS